jgi:hypothetical protein
VTRRIRFRRIRSDNDESVLQWDKLGSTGATLIGTLWECESPAHVGRLESSDIVLMAPSVSRRHAEIEPVEDGWRLRDLGSTNGTFWNGDRLSPDDCALLQYGDLIQFGTVPLVVDAIDEDETTPEPGYSWGNDLFVPFPRLGDTARRFGLSGRAFKSHVELAFSTADVDLVSCACGNGRVGIYTVGSVDPAAFVAWLPLGLGQCSVCGLIHWVEKFRTAGLSEQTPMQPVQAVIGEELRVNDLRSLLGPAPARRARFDAEGKFLGGFAGPSFGEN